MMTPTTAAIIRPVYCQWNSGIALHRLEFEAGGTLGGGLRFRQSRERGEGLRQFFAHGRRLRQAPLAGQVAGDLQFAAHFLRRVGRAGEGLGVPGVVQEGAVLLEVRRAREQVLRGLGQRTREQVLPQLP